MRCGERRERRREEGEEKGGRREKNWSKTRLGDNHKCFIVHVQELEVTFQSS